MMIYHLSEENPIVTKPPSSRLRLLRTIEEVTRVEHIVNELSFFFLILCLFRLVSRSYFNSSRFVRRKRRETAVDWASGYLDQLRRGIAIFFFFFCIYRRSMS